MISKLIDLLWMSLGFPFPLLDALSGVYRSHVGPNFRLPPEREGGGARPSVRPPQARMKKIRV